MSESILKRGIVLKALFLSVLITFSVSTIACEIELKVSEDYKKESYKVGDELVVEVYVVLNHRNCHIDISETKFKVSGGKIVGATKWAKKQTNSYFRKLKVKITEDNKPDIKIICQRTCDKEGGLTKIALKKG